MKGVLAVAARSPRGGRAVPILRAGILAGIVAASLSPAAFSQDAHEERSTEGRKERVERFGGTPLTENAVEAGLNWLAAHQERDGSWDRVSFQRRCPRDDECPGAAVERLDASLRPGLTGLVVLAFLGAGYTDREGPHQQTVKLGIDALLRLQYSDGGFSRDAMAGYDNVLATFALAEYAALTHDERVREPLRRAVALLVQSQQHLGGWDYVPRPDSARNDTSITAWMVQALHAARAAGQEVPSRTLVRASLHFARCGESDGRVWYADAGTGFKLDPQSTRPVYRYGAAMTAAALLSEQLLGWRSDAPLVRRQRAVLLAEPPSLARLQGGDDTGLHSEYYWYYGTVAMFQSGGAEWEEWNARLRDAILPLQSRDMLTGEKRRHRYGSWEPFGTGWGRWSRMGGRVYATALHVLTLETYYRHTPAYLRRDASLTAADWRTYLADARERERLWSVRALRGMRLEIGEPVLVELLKDEVDSIALASAEGLLDVDSPAGRSILAAAAERATGGERVRLDERVKRCRSLDERPAAQGRFRVLDEPSKLATLELPRAYAGMNCAVQRGGETLVRARVIQRFSGRDVVVAELLAAPAQPLREGDAVVSIP